MIDGREKNAKYLRLIFSNESFFKTIVFQKNHPMDLPDSSLCSQVGIIGWHDDELIKEIINNNNEIIVNSPLPTHTLDVKLW